MFILERIMILQLKAWDNSGKISKLHLAFAADNRQGLGTEDSYMNGKLDRHYS